MAINLVRRTLKRVEHVRFLRILVVAFTLTIVGCSPVEPDAEIDLSNYVIDENVLIKMTDGGTLSATIVRPKGAHEPLPTALNLTIYTRDFEYRRDKAMEAASRGYVGIVADTRGKRLSLDAIEPYKHNVDDTYDLIEWISGQEWSNGEVGMYGGSYDGYTAWAATKRGHPALKTIVPYVAAIPGHGLPMENNVFISANYAWPFYVANNKFLDDETYRDERWQNLPQDWWDSGRPYREIDKIEGTPNPMLQEWLTHPGYDEYWQAMVPYGTDFEKIEIPVLTITGYYDDGQISALQYLREHFKHKPDADHYLLIGPYSHFGAQSATKPTELRGYQIDPVAQFDTVQITYEWLDYVLKGAPKPSLLVDKINHQVMGADIWAHARDFDGVSNDTLTLYLTDAQEEDHLLLSDIKREPVHDLSQSVDFADRSTFGASYYPSPIIREELDLESGFSFISEPFAEEIRVNGSFSGVLHAKTNKRDFDYQVILYEVTPAGDIFQLSYAIGRASYAGDMSVRRTLEPGQWVSLPFDRTRMTSKQLRVGSRLLIVLDIIKDPFHQVNYGTGGDVSDESIDDAGEALEVNWRTDSFVAIPIWREADAE